MNMWFLPHIIGSIRIIFCHYTLSILTCFGVAMLSLTMVLPHMRSVLLQSQSKTTSQLIVCSSSIPLFPLLATYGLR